MAINKSYKKKKRHESRFKEKDPGGDLLSHEETSHYHWRKFVSLLSSRRDQVVPNRYSRQENWFGCLIRGSRVDKEYGIAM